jgi:uncharacterized repeat protein (TIGR03803 family)
MRLLCIAWGMIVILGTGGTSQVVAQTVTNLYSFGSPNDGYDPSGVAQGNDGNFYGTTSFGGTFGFGTVFRISPSGSYRNLYSFSGPLTDGAYPFGKLVQGSDGNFYGTTAFGGTSTNCSFGCGTVFRISPSGDETPIYSFDGPSNAAVGSLVQGSDGSFYGTTQYGGMSTNCGADGYRCGTVFRVSSSGNYTLLHSFGSFPADGIYPDAALVRGRDGNFYGTAGGGGTIGAGTVFRISPSGSYSNLYSFASPSGAYPQAGLVQGSDGNFYGTTGGGGTIGVGTVFRISPSGTETTLYSFVGSPDGASPEAELVQGSDGNFYGTTYQGGTSNSGTIFRVSSSGIETTLYSFASAPNGVTTARIAGLVQGRDGYFYGTTSNGGANNSGTVYRLSVPLSPPPYPINQITAIQQAGTNVVFTIPSVAGETYQLQVRASLNDGGWSNIVGASVVNSIGALLTLTNLGGAAQAQAFYRVGIRLGGIPLPAFDNAADPVYSGGWTNGSNGGYGFGPWKLTATSLNVNTNGYIVGTSTNNAFGTSPGIDTFGQSWGIYAYGGNYTAAYRTFADGSLAVGQSLLLSMDNGYIDNGQSDGFVLRTGNASSTPIDYNVGSRFEFFYLGFDPTDSYKVVDSSGVHNIGTGFTGTGKRLVFTLNTADTYTLLTIDNATGTTNSFSGTLAGSAGSPVDSIAMYNRNAGNGTNYYAFFNSLQITGP